ncbi:MAG: 3-phosphoshikimate 1-carboxyvinyltransferase [Chlamydiia bacterium]|nr:3-phosphoshikimate 1-carboxyvinyltransferase [Chlamydiia bacterium]
MSCTIEKSSLSGTLTIPPSKSHTHRALLFALLADGTSIIDNFLDSPDISAMIDAVWALGGEIKQVGRSLHVTGTGGKLRAPTSPIDAKNSGIILRFIGGLAALSDVPITITGDHSIQTRRPVLPLLEGLKELGAEAISLRNNAYAPIQVCGPLRSGSCTIEGADSQPVSALLIAAAFSKGPFDLHVTNPGEKPWIDLTLSWFDFLGIPYTNRSYTHYTIPGGATLSPFTFTVPGDFSTLTFPVAAALITNSPLRIEGVVMNDVQGDKKFLSMIQEMGAVFAVEKTTLIVKKPPPLQGKTFDINESIDSLPILAVLGCFSEGETHLTNGEIARKKECDRIDAICRELKKMGADIQEREDGLIVKKSKLKGALLETYNDHRMAMALSVAAMGAEGPSTLRGIATVSKTYPHFYDDMKQLGAKIT